jgi:uncharacterized protein (TIGR03083 family)
MSDANASPAELPYDPLAHVRTDGQELLAIVSDHDLDVDVASCPGWNLGELAWHMGGVWNFWGRVVAERVTSVDTIRDWDQPDRPADELLIDWVTSAHTSLVSALTRAVPDQEVWTWTGANRDVRWVERRMTQETAVHRWDAADAVGVHYDIPVAVAADGIDEYLTWFAHAGRSEADAAALAGTVHLHCIDTGADVDEGSDDRSTGRRRVARHGPRRVGRDVQPGTRQGRRGDQGPGERPVAVAVGTRRRPAGVLRRRVPRRLLPHLPR